MLLLSARVRDYPHLRGCLTAVNGLKNIFPTSEKNMVYKTCIPADFILMRHWRSIGHGGAGIGKPYCDLLAIVRDKDYFVLTTNVDHQFQLAGFDKKRLFYTQGDYGLWQCSKPCHQKTYDNEAAVRQMAAQQKDMKIPEELIPKCPVCGAPMTMNLRCDMTFVQDDGWYAAAGRYDDFIRRHRGLHVLFLEIGVGANTPGIIKYPFWQMTAKNRKAIYACVNFGEAFVPGEIADRSICINKDVGEVLEQVKS